MRGFSLLELAIAVLIIGILFAGFVGTYERYHEKRVAYKTSQALDISSKGLVKYFASYSHYPCPASKSAGPGDADFGVEGNCETDFSVAPGSCAADGSYCVTSRMVDHDGDIDTPMISMRIRIGSVPWRTMNEGTEVAATPGSDLYDELYPIGNGDTLDGYGRRLTYAVAENQATTQYLQGNGALQVQDEYGRSLNDRADFILVSHGPNGNGAGTMAGGEAACDAAMPRDSENCDRDGVFIDSLQYDIAGANYYDDRVQYVAWLGYFLWDVSQIEDESIYNLNTGNIGIGLTDPEEKLHVKDGNVLMENGLHATDICDENGADCFSSDYIAGTALNTCPDGSVMTGVAFKTAACQPLLAASSSSTCPADTATVKWYMTGYTYNTVNKTFQLLCCSPQLDASNVNSCKHTP